MRRSVLVIRNSFFGDRATLLSRRRNFHFHSFEKFDPMLNHQLKTICRRVKRVRLNLNEGPSCKRYILIIPNLFSWDQIRKAVKFLDEVALAKGQFLNLRHHLVQTHLPLHYHLIQTIHLQRYRSQAPPLYTTSSRLQYSFFGNRNGIRNSSQLLVSLLSRVSPFSSICQCRLQKVCERSSKLYFQNFISKPELNSFFSVR